MSQSHIPYVTKPVLANLAKSISNRPLGQSYLPFHKCTTRIHIHQRLMGSIAKAPSIAIFPWLVDVLKETYIKRATRVRQGDLIYASSASAFLSWPLDKRRIRLGLFQSASGTTKNHYATVWVVGMVKEEGECGYTVFIFDDHATAQRETMGVTSAGKILGGQQTMLNLLLAKKYKIKSLLYGGRPWKGRAEKCVESCMSFIEGFVDDMSKAEFSMDMLTKWDLQNIPLKGLKSM